MSAVDTMTGSTPGHGAATSEVVGAVMGTTAHVVARGSSEAAVGLDELRRLERLWTRFSDDSELSRLGRGDGTAAIVSAETALLIDRSEWAFELTGGLFDATLIDAVERAGYDRSFELLEQIGADDARRAVQSSLQRSSLREGDRSSIDSDPRTGLVQLPAGVRVDPGGIGKGLAADLVATSLCDSGATGSLVSVGGDLRAVGSPPDGGWEIELDHHVVALARINLISGAVATSTRLRRCWRSGEGVAHHIIDARTGQPSQGPAVAVSVVATEAWRAEAIATAVLVGYGTPGFEELAPALLGDAGALVTTADLRRHRLGRLGSTFLVIEPVELVEPGEVALGNDPQACPEVQL